MFPVQAFKNIKVFFDSDMVLTLDKFPEKFVVDIGVNLKIRMEPKIIGESPEVANGETVNRPDYDPVIKGSLPIWMFMKFVI